MIKIERPNDPYLTLTDATEVGLILAAASKYEKQLKGLNYKAVKHPKGGWYLRAESPVLDNAWHDYGAKFVRELGGFTFVATCRICGELANYTECEFCGHDHSPDDDSNFDFETNSPKMVFDHETLTDHERSNLA